MGTFEELPIELQISIMEYAVPIPKKRTRKKKTLCVKDFDSYIEYLINKNKLRSVYNMSVCQYKNCEPILAECHTPTSSYLQYDKGWLQTVYDYNNKAYEPDIRIAKTI